MKITFLVPVWSTDFILDGDATFLNPEQMEATEEFVLRAEYERGPGVWEVPYTDSPKLSLHNDVMGDVPDWCKKVYYIVEERC